MAILAGVTPSESDKVRHSALAGENLTNNQPSAITWIRCKIGGKLVLISNRKSGWRWWQPTTGLMTMHAVTCRLTA